MLATKQEIGPRSVDVRRWYLAWGQRILEGWSRKLSAWRLQMPAAMVQWLRGVWYSSIVRLPGGLYNLLATLRAHAQHSRTTFVVWKQVLQEILRHNPHSIFHPLIEQQMRRHWRPVCSSPSPPLAPRHQLTSRFHDTGCMVWATTSTTIRRVLPSALLRRTTHYRRVGS